MKPWGSMWWEPFFFLSALLLSFCHVSSLLKSHAVKERIFLISASGDYTSFKMNNICKLELHIFIRLSHSVKKKRASYAMKNINVIFLYEQYYKFMNKKHISTCYPVEFLLFILCIFRQIHPHRVICGCILQEDVCLYHCAGASRTVGFFSV